MQIAKAIFQISQCCHGIIFNVSTSVKDGFPYFIHSTCDMIRTHRNRHTKKIRLSRLTEMWESNEHYGRVRSIHFQNVQKSVVADGEGVVVAKKFVRTCVPLDPCPTSQQPLGASTVRPHLLDSTLIHPDSNAA